MMILVVSAADGFHSGKALFENVGSALLLFKPIGSSHD